MPVIKRAHDSQPLSLDSSRTESDSLADRSSQSSIVLIKKTRKPSDRYEMRQAIFS